MNRDEADQIVRQVIEAGAALGLREKDILSRAGLGKTTLSKIKSSHDARVSTLSRMANAVGLRLTLAPKNPTLNQLLNRELFSKESSVRP